MPDLESYNRYSIMHGVMRRLLNRHLPVMLAVCTIAAAACGPKTYNFIKLDHPKASEHLLEDVEIYYDGEPLPKGTNVITHIELTGRNTDCETAATIAIVKMQKQARFKGGDALVNLKTKATGDEDDDDDEGGEPTHNDKGFWCTRMNTLEGGADLTHRVWEITWEGDIAILGEGLPEVEEEAKDEEEEKEDKDEEPEEEDKPVKKPKKEEEEEEEEEADDSDMVFEPSDVDDVGIELEDSDDIY